MGGEVEVCDRGWEVRGLGVRLGWEARRGVVEDET